MTDTTTPVSAFFDAQRTAIEQSHEAFQQSLRFQQRATEAMLSGLDTTDAAREGSVAATEAAIDAYFDAVEATVPGADEILEDIRATAHDQLAEADDLGAEFWSQVVDLVETNVEAADDANEELESMVADAVEETLAAHEDLEAEALDAAEAVEVPIDDA